VATLAAPVPTVARPALPRQRSSLSLNHNTDVTEKFFVRVDITEKITSASERQRSPNLKEAVVMAAPTFTAEATLYQPERSYRSSSPLPADSIRPAGRTDLCFCLYNNQILYPCGAVVPLPPGTPDGLYVCVQGNWVRIAQL